MQSYVHIVTAWQEPEKIAHTSLLCCMLSWLKNETTCTSHICSWLQPSLRTEVYTVINSPVHYLCFLSFTTQSPYATVSDIIFATPRFDKAPSANATPCSSHKTPENSSHRAEK